MGLTNVGGIFVVLLGRQKLLLIRQMNNIILYSGGVCLSLLVAVLEFLWHARKNHEHRQVHLNNFFLFPIVYFRFLSIQSGGN